MTTYTKTDVLLSIQNLSLTLGGRLILRDINAEIREIVRPDMVQGQVVCFLGQAGIGKTQLSRCIAGLQPPTSGQVYVDSGDTVVNHPVHGDAQILRPVVVGDVGVVPQDYPLARFLTVAENLHLAGVQAGLTDLENTHKAAGLMERFDVAKFAGLYPKALSGGTRQRVAILQQLMCAGHYLVMDEPFASLDLINKERACSLITEVANLDSRNTIIIVTHDVTEGLSVADTVWMMGREHGKDGATLLPPIDMAAEDLCWHPDLIHEARFIEFVADVKQRFHTLT